MIHQAQTKWLKSYLNSGRVWSNVLGSFMSDFFGHHTAQFAPRPNDSIRELRWKAESMLEYLRENESELRKFPTGFVDERRTLWQPLADLLAKAMEQPDLAMDARLEAQRVWAEEMRQSALFIVTMCVHARSDSARQRFADDPEKLDELIENLEQSRPVSLEILSTDDMKFLRENGFLRPGE